MLQANGFLSLGSTSVCLKLKRSKGFNISFNNFKKHKTHLSFTVTVLFNYESIAL